MHITTTRTQFLKALSRTVPVASAKSTRPILCCVRLSASGGSVTIEATDLQQSVKDSAPAEVLAEGAICANARDLLERIKAMPEGSVNLRLVNGGLEVKSCERKLTYRLSAVDAAEFPDAIKPAKGVTVELDSSMFKSVFQSISADNARSNLHACHVEVDGKSLKLTATNGHALTIARKGFDSKEKSKALLSRETVEQLIRLDGKLSITFGDTEPYAWTEYDGLIHCAKLVDANFPSIAPVLQKHCEYYAAKVNRDVLAKSIQAVGLAADKKTFAVTMTFRDDVLRLQAQGPDEGESVDEIACEYQGPEVMLGMNKDYIRILCDQAADEELSLELGSAPLSPVHWVSGDVCGVVMPMRI